MNGLKGKEVFGIAAIVSKRGIVNYFKCITGSLNLLLNTFRHAIKQNLREVFKLA